MKVLGTQKIGEIIPKNEGRLWVPMEDANHWNPNKQPATSRFFEIVVFFLLNDVCLKNKNSNRHLEDTSFSPQLCFWKESFHICILGYLGYVLGHFRRLLMTFICSSPFTLKSPFFCQPKSVPFAVDTPAWRIIPVSKWLVTHIHKPFRPFGRVPTTRSLGDLRSPWFLTTY